MQNELNKQSLTRFWSLGQIYSLSLLWFVLHASRSGRLGVQVYAMFNLGQNLNSKRAIKLGRREYWYKESSCGTEAARHHVKA